MITFWKLMFCSLLQFIRSVISWAVTDVIGRAQGLTPLYGSKKQYPILALRGFLGAVAMTLYYEAFERLMLGEAVCPSCSHWPSIIKHLHLASCIIVAAHSHFHPVVECLEQWGQATALGPWMVCCT